MASSEDKSTDESAARRTEILSRPVQFENDETVETLWAMKAVEHAEIYFNILCSVDPKFLKLTPKDDIIYNIFREKFPNMKVDVLNEDQIKSRAGKELWRPFCEHFKDIIDDYSFGTLIRVNCKGDYSQANSILTTRIQFYAIEISRNREGLNDSIRKTYRPTQATQVADINVGMKGPTKL